MGKNESSDRHTKSEITATAFVILLIIFTYLVYSFFLVHEDKNATEYCACGSATQKQLEKQYEVVTSEIKERLGHQFELILYQFVLIGGVFALLLKMSRTDNIRESHSYSDLFRLILGIVAIGLLIIDLHYVANDYMMNRAGTWVRQCYEGFNPSKEWEEFILGGKWAFRLTFQYASTAIVLSGYYLTVINGRKTDYAWSFMNLPIFACVCFMQILFLAFNMISIVNFSDTVESHKTDLGGVVFFSIISAIWIASWIWMIVRKWNILWGARNKKTYLSQPGNTSFSAPSK